MQEEVPKPEPDEPLKAFDELRLIVVIEKTEYLTASVKFAFPWHLINGRDTVILELYNGKGKDLKPIKVAATRIEFL